MYKVKLLECAWHDLDDIIDYHAREVGMVSARKIAGKILNDIGRLEAFPQSCPLAPYEALAAKNLRALVSGKYTCLYKLEGAMVYVYRIVLSASNYPRYF